MHDVYAIVSQLRTLSIHRARNQLTTKPGPHAARRLHAIDQPSQCRQLVCAEQRVMPCEECPGIQREWPRHDRQSMVVTNMEISVGRYNYRDQFGSILPSLLNKLEAMLLEGSYILSPEVEEFEKAFADFLGVRHVLGVNTGTDALTIGLRVLGIGPEDEVITQANTFHATVLAIVNCPARPVLVDADERTFLMDQNQLLAALSSRTRALLPVHLYGKPTPLDHILHVAKTHGLHVIEDACQAHGARWQGHPAGTLGDVGCFSFHPSKNLAAAGDGGAIATNSDRYASAIKVIRSLGQEQQNHHVTLGLNSRLDAVQAAILLAKLPQLEVWNQHRRAIAALYRERLQNLPLRLQDVAEGEEHVFHLFQIRTSSRDDLLCHLRRRRIDAVVRYPVPIHLQPAFHHLGWKPGQFPVAEQLSRELLALPIRADMNVAEVDHVCDSIRSFFVG